MTELRSQLVRSVAEECGGRAVAFDPDARAYEAFGLGRETALLAPLAATSLDEALAETTSRWRWDRGDRLGVRELGENVDNLHVYAARRTTTVTSYYRGAQGLHVPLEYKRRLEHICTINLLTIAGVPPLRFSDNPSLEQHYRKEDERRQAQRPEGARK